MTTYQKRLPYGHKLRGVCAALLWREILVHVKKHTRPVWSGYYKPSHNGSTTFQISRVNFAVTALILLVFSWNISHIKKIRLISYIPRHQIESLWVQNPYCQVRWDRCLMCNGIEPGLHWWKASTLTAKPSSHLHVFEILCHENIQCALAISCERLWCWGTLYSVFGLLCFWLLRRLNLWLLQIFVGRVLNIKKKNVHWITVCLTFAKQLAEQPWLPGF